MKLLIVGASGFIGKNLIEEASSGPYPFREIAGTYRSDDSFPAFAKSHGVHPIRFDGFDDNPRLDSYDCTIYVGGNSNHTLARENPILDLKMNTIPVLNLLKRIEGRLVFLSSAGVYYGLSGKVHPKMNLNPTFNYGISKLTAEHYISAYHQERKLDSCVILRLYYAFGKYDRQNRLIPNVVSTLLAGQKEFTVSGDGKSRMDPLGAGFIAKVLAASAADRSVQGIFDLCGGNAEKVKSIVKKISNVLKKSIRVKENGIPEKFPLTFFSTPSPLFKRLKIKRAEPFEKGLHDYLDWALKTGVL